MAQHARSRSVALRLWRSSKIDSLLFDDGRPSLNVGMNRSDIFAHDPDKQQLNAEQEEDANHHGRDSDREIFPEQKLQHQEDQGGENAQKPQQESKERGNPNGNFRMAYNPEHRDVVESIEIIF